MFMTGRSIVMLGAALLLSIPPALTQDPVDASAGLPYGLPQPCVASGVVPGTPITFNAIVDDAVICLSAAGT